MIRRRPRAIFAIIDMAEYIGRDSPGAAERFLDAAKATFKRLEEMPGMGHLFESSEARLTGVRVCPVKWFPNHLIFYRPVQAGIEVLHVLHGSRDIDAILGHELESGDL
jgi:toxin ParE1/3/4